MNNKFSILALVISITALGVTYFHSHNENNMNPKQETAYERVLRTHTLRCGYNIWPPSIMEDKEGKLTGAYVEFMEELARNANLKLEWTTKLDWGTFPQDLESGKVDAMCAGIWADAKRGVYTAWTVPVWYNLIDVYVRADDTRFPTDQDKLDTLNSEDVTIAIVDGTATAQIAEKYYPKAKKFSVPALADVSDSLLAVTNHKADAVFVDTAAAQTYQHNNAQNNLRRFTKGDVAVYPQDIGVNIHENELQNLLNAATNEIVNLGIAERIARKYDPQGLNFVIPATPYKLSEQK